MKTLILIACLLASGPALAYCNYGDTPCERLERMEEQQNRIKADLRVLQYGKPGKKCEGLKHHGDAACRAVDGIAHV